MSARDTSGSAPQHSHPHNNTMSRNEKFWVGQVTVPHPPLGNDKGWGTTRGGGTRFCNNCPYNDVEVVWAKSAGLGYVFNVSGTPHPLTRSASTHWYSGSARVPASVSSEEDHMPRLWYQAIVYCLNKGLMENCTSLMIYVRRSGSLPPPPLSKHGKSQTNNGRTGSCA